MTLEIPTELEAQLELIARQRNISIEELVLEELRRELVQFEARKLAKDEFSLKPEEIASQEQAL